MQHEALMRADARAGQLEATLSGLEASLQGLDYLQSSFGAADVAVGSSLLWAKQSRGEQVCMLMICAPSA